jgi:hypothetical protein
LILVNFTTAVIWLIVVVILLVIFNWIFSLVSFL